MTSCLPPSMDDAMRELLSAETTSERRSLLFDAIVAEPVTTCALASAVRVVREYMIPVTVPDSPIDTCGTGGSKKSRINTSTIAAFVVAAAEGKVAKHGNRAMSGTCGAFDLLEGLGIHIHLGATEAQSIYKELGVTFLYAPLFHPSMALIAPHRKAYGKATIFNLVGPLCNPASVTQQIIGTPSGEKQDLLANVLEERGGETAMIVCGDDGLDEVTLAGTSTIRHIPGNHTTTFHPTELGIPVRTSEELMGGSIDDNVSIATDILRGKEKGARRDLVLVNAAFALQLSRGIEHLATAFSLAAETIATGKAYRLMQKYLEASHDLA